MRKVNKEMTKKLIILSLLMYPSLLSLGACSSPTEFATSLGDGFKNVFISKADLAVTDIKSPDLLKGVSIIQTFKAAVVSSSGNISEYKFNNPTVTIVNRPGLPRVIFKQMLVQYTVGDKQLPVAKFPITFTVPTGGQFSGSVPILSSSTDLLSAVFPNNSTARVGAGNAQVTLLGLDDNNNVVSLSFGTPILFESDLSGAVLATPTPSPSGSSNPAN